MSNRRQFIFQVSANTALGATLCAATMSAQAADPMLAETDPQAVALGYKADTTKVDAKKFPAHVKTQLCTNCALYKAAKPTDKAGACPLFANKQVAGNGWCSAWVKKAA